VSAEDLETLRLSYFRDLGCDVRSWRFADPQGRESYVFRAGGDGVPLVLIHGGLDHACAWTQVAPHLRRPLVMPDRPGCGLSHPVDYRGVAFRQAAADWLLALVDALGVDQIDLVGNSMGGYFSAAFATAHPDRVRTLTLPGCPASFDRRIPFFMRLMGRPVIGPRLAKMTALEPDKARRQIFPGLVAHPERIPERLLELGAMNAAQPKAQQCVHSMLAAFTTLGGVRPEVALREDLERLDVPTLFVWGDKDQFGPPSTGEALVQRMPNARLEILEDVGHLPHLEAPQRLAGLIEAFIEAHALRMWSSTTTASARSRAHGSNSGSDPPA